MQVGEKTRADAAGLGENETALGLRRYGALAPLLRERQHLEVEPPEDRPERLDGDPVVAELADSLVEPRGVLRDALSGTSPEALRVEKLAHAMALTDRRLWRQAQLEVRHIRDAGEEVLLNNRLDFSAVLYDGIAPTDNHEFCICEGHRGAALCA